MKLESNIIDQAIAVLNTGGIIIYPTDTAFGMGCRIDNKEAVDKFFALRKRPLSKAPPLLVASKAMALSYLDHPSEIVRRLIDHYWPGALTIVAPCKKDVLYSPLLGADGTTIGVRMPNHETILKIIEGVGVPIIGSSANFHGEPTPYSSEAINPELANLVDLIVPGTVVIGNVSTVVDCSVDPYKILRQGAIRL